MVQGEAGHVTRLVDASEAPDLCRDYMYVDGLRLQLREWFALSSMFRESCIFSCFGIGSGLALAKCRLQITCDETSLGYRLHVLVT